MEYVDFELEIGPRTGRDHAVEVLRSPAGEARAVMRFPFDELELENKLLRLQNALLQPGETRRRMLSPETQVVQDFGRELFDSLLTGDVRSSYDVSRREALREGRGLRIKLRIQDPGLASLPWEFLYDPRVADFIALSRYTPLVRYLDLPHSIQPLQITAPLRILAMAVSPSDLPPLNVEREKLRLERALEKLQAAGVVELRWLEGGGWRDLQRAMRGGPWHVFHFVGHGRFDPNADEGIVAFAGEYGDSSPLSATQLGNLLGDHPSLRLVLLNACEGARGGSQDIFSGTASILVRRGIPAVIAMQYEITDRAAVEFSRSFYEAVADELPVDAAVAEARKAVDASRANTFEWGTPVLYMRATDGVLFRVSKPAGRPAEGPAVEPDGAAKVPDDARVETLEFATPIEEVRDELTVQPPDTVAPPEEELAPPPEPSPRSRIRSPAGLALIAVVVLAAAGLGIRALTGDPTNSPSRGPTSTGGPTGSPAGQTTAPTTPPGQTTAPPVQTELWTRASTSPVLGGPGDQWMQKVTEGGPGVIAVGAASGGSDTDAAIWTSPDGLDWTRARGASSSTFGGAGTQVIFGVVEADDGFVAVGYESAGQGNDAAVWTSDDGLTWERVRSAGFGGPGDQQMNRATWDGSRFIAVGYAGSQAAVWLSSDRRTWTRVASQPAFQVSPGGMRLRSVAAREGAIVAVGFETSAGTNRPAVLRSTDGEAWERVSGGRAFEASGSQMATVVAGPDGFVVVGYDTIGARQRGAAWVSDDGRSWRRAKADQAAFGGSDRQELFVVTLVDGIFQAGGSDGDRAAVWTSTDGLTWTESKDVEAFSSSKPLVINGLAGLGGGTVAVGWSESSQGKDALSWRSETG